MYQGDAVFTELTQKKKTNWLLSFTGLIPVIMAIPIIILHQWVLSIIVTLVSALTVIVYHLSKKQGITSAKKACVLYWY